MSIRM